jgi:hypothetical protein
MEQIKDKFIIFPKLDSKHINIIVFVISSLLRVVVPNFIQTNFASIEHNGHSFFKEICYFDMLTNFIGDISVGFYKIITIFGNKQNQNPNPSTSVEEKTKKEMLKKFFIILPLIAFIDTLAQLCLYSFSFLDNKGIVLGVGQSKKIIHEQDLFFLVGIDIFFRYIFSLILLKSYFYKHHYLSMLLTFIGFIPLMIINILDLNKSMDSDYVEEKNYKLISIYYIILNTIRAILYSLEDVFNKIALNKLLIRPFELMFYKAIFEIIPTIIFTLISKSQEDFSLYTEKHFHDSKLFGRILYRLFFIIFNIFRTISLITIIEKLNPNHLSILKSMEFIVNLIYIMIWNSIYEKDFKLNWLNLIIEIFCCLILLLGSVIHNEMIIINKWGLLECTYYYKKYILRFDEKNLEEDNKKKNKKTVDSLLGESL